MLHYTNLLKIIASHNSLHNLPTNLLVVLISSSFLSTSIKTTRFIVRHSLHDKSAGCSCIGNSTHNGIPFNNSTIVMGLPPISPAEKTSDEKLILMVHA